MFFVRLTEENHHFGCPPQQNSGSSVKRLFSLKRAARSHPCAGFQPFAPPMPQAPSLECPPDGLCCPSDPREGVRLPKTWAIFRCFVAHGHTPYGCFSHLVEICLNQSGLHKTLLGSSSFPQNLLVSSSQQGSFHYTPEIVVSLLIRWKKQHVSNGCSPA